MYSRKVTPTCYVRLAVLSRSWFSLIGVCLLLLCAGCVAYREPLAESPNESPLPANPGLARVNLRVRYPQACPQCPQELLTWNSDRVVHALSATGLFGSVEYAAETNPPNTLLISAVFPPAPHCDGDAVFLLFLTAGLFPASCDRDAGVYFDFFD